MSYILQTNHMYKIIYAKKLVTNMNILVKKMRYIDF